MEVIEDKWFTVQYSYPQTLLGQEPVTWLVDQSPAGIKLWSKGHARRKARGCNNCSIIPVTVVLGEPIDPRNF